MADVDLQALLDAGSTKAGIQIVRRVDAGTLTSYYCTGQVLGKGQAKWINCTTADSDETKDTAIRTAFGI
jgi:hypothetical protein